MSIDDINLIGASVLAILSFALLGGLLHADGKSHHKAFAVFWGVVCVLMLVNFLLFRFTSILVHHAWISICIDAIGNVALFLAAYSLHKGSAFTWRDKVLHVGYAATPALMLVMLLFGVLVQRDTLIWKLFYIAPSALLASVAFICLGVAVFREPATQLVRWPVLITFCTYAFLQIPGYICIFASAPGLEKQMEEGRRIIMIFIACGKLTLVAAFVATILAARGPQVATSVLTGAKWTLSILTLGFTCFVFLYRISQAFHLFSL